MNYGVNGVTELDPMIPTVIATKIYDELRSNNSLFSNFFSREYEGEIRSQGDTVTVNQITAPEGEILTSDKQAFQSEALVVTPQSIVADSIAIGSFKITDLAKLQSVEFQQEVINALVYAVQLKMEANLYAALVPSTTAPDHEISPASAGLMAAVDVGTLRTLLSIAKVPVTDRGLFLSPSYYGDLCNSNVITSADFSPSNLNSGVTGQVRKFQNFDIQEHNLLGNDIAIAAHKSALQVVMQKSVEIKISDLHSNNQLAYLMSAHIVFGKKLMDNKRIVRMTA